MGTDHNVKQDRAAEERARDHGCAQACLATGEDAQHEQGDADEGAEYRDDDRDLEAPLRFTGAELQDDERAVDDGDKATPTPTQQAD